MFHRGVLILFLFLMVGEAVIRLSFLLDERKAVVPAIVNKTRDSRDASKIHSVFLLWCFLLQTPLSQCSSSPKEDRRPVEVAMTLFGAVGEIRDKRPLSYALVVDVPVEIHVSAEKVGVRLDSQMTLEIHLPPEIALRAGESSWSGTDKSKKLKVEVVPRRIGEFELTASAENLGIPFRDTAKIRLQVFRNVGSAEEWIQERRR